MEEARTALVNGEIRTPSAVSSWSSEGLDADIGEVGPSHRGRTPLESSSGEEYLPRRSTGKSYNSPGSTEEDVLTDSSSYGSDEECKDSDAQRCSEEDIEDDSFQTSEESSETEGSWEAANTSTTSASSSGEDFSIVSFNLHFFFFPKRK